MLENDDFKISVIMPVFNREKTVKGALNSIKGQTYKNFEVIIIDDGSTDKTYDEILPFLEDSRFHYFYQENSGKPSIARNSGIRKAKYDWLAFLDSDDEWEPWVLSAQVNTLRSYYNCGVKLVFTDSQKTMNGKLLYRSFLQRQGVDCALDKATLGNNRHGRYFDSISFQRALCKAGFLLSPCILVEKALFLHAGGFDESLTYAEDMDTWLTVSSLCNVGQSHGVGFVYRWHSKSITASDEYALFSDTIKVLEKHERRVGGDVDSLRNIRARLLRYRIHLLEYLIKNSISVQGNSGIKLSMFFNITWNFELLKTFCKKIRFVVLGVLRNTY